MVYGKKTPTRYSDPEVIEIEKTLKRVVECLHPGTYLVDSFPFLKYFPTPEMRKLQRYQKEELDLFKRQLGVVRRQIVSPMSDECPFRTNFHAIFTGQQRGYPT